MKTTGITRRIDELGRVVIPKEIRKNMHIKPGELLEIYLSDNETISLRKHNIINNSQTFIKEYINCLAVKINCNIYITNMDEIIFSNEKKEEEGKISKELESYTFSKKNEDTFNITKTLKINRPYSIHPISPNGDLVGYMVFDYKHDNQEFYNNLINFSVSFIENYLETN